MPFSSVQDLIDAEAKRRAMRDAEMRQGFKSSAAQLADAAGLAYQIEGDKKAEALRLRKQDAAEKQQVIENEAAQAAAGREVEALRLKTAADGRAAEAHAQALRLANEEGARKAADDARKTADAARAQAIERISLIDPTMLPEGVDPKAAIIAAAGGLIPDEEALQINRDALNARANERDARKLTAANTESQIKARDAGVAQGWRGLEIDKQRADTAAAAAAAKPGADGDLYKLDPNKDGPRYRKALTDLGQAKVNSKTLRDLSKKYKIDDYVGPIDGLAYYLQRKTGMSATEAATVQASIKRYFDAYRKYITGAAASVQELKSLEGTAPIGTDSWGVILGKLDAADAASDDGIKYIGGLLDSGTTRGIVDDVRGTAASAAPVYSTSDMLAD